GVLREPVGDVAVQEAAALLQRLGEIPVKECAERLDARAEDRIGQPIVEVEPARVRRTSTVREHAWPRDAESISGKTERLHERNVFRVAVIVVTRDVARVPFEDGTGSPAKDIPIALAL